MALNKSLPTSVKITENQLEVQGQSVCRRPVDDESGSRGSRKRERHASRDTGELGLDRIVIEIGSASLDEETLPGIHPEFTQDDCIDSESEKEEFDQRLETNLQEVSLADKSHSLISRQDDRDVCRFLSSESTYEKPAQLHSEAERREQRIGENFAGNNPGHGILLRDVNGMERGMVNSTNTQLLHDDGCVIHGLGSSPERRERDHPLVSCRPLDSTTNEEVQLIGTHLSQDGNRSLRSQEGQHPTLVRQYSYGQIHQQSIWSSGEAQLGSSSIIQPCDETEHPIAKRPCSRHRQCDGGLPISFEPEVGMDDACTMVQSGGTGIRDVGGYICKSTNQTIEVLHGLEREEERILSGRWPSECMAQTSLGGATNQTSQSDTEIVNQMASGNRSNHHSGLASSTMVSGSSSDAGTEINNSSEDRSEGSSAESHQVTQDLDSFIRAGKPFRDLIRLGCFGQRAADALMKNTLRKEPKVESRWRSYIDYLKDHSYPDPLSVATITDFMVHRVKTSIDGFGTNCWNGKSSHHYNWCF